MRKEFAPNFGNKFLAVALWQCIISCFLFHQGISDQKQHECCLPSTLLAWLGLLGLSWGCHSDTTEVTEAEWHVVLNTLTEHDRGQTQAPVAKIMDSSGIHNMIFCLMTICTLVGSDQHYATNTEPPSECSRKWAIQHLYNVKYIMAHTFKTYKTNSMAFCPQANYTDWATATCQRNLVPTFVDRGVSHGQAADPLRSLISVF
jgi:hypothetical protein